MGTLYKSLLAILLLTQTACSFNAALFGWSDDSSKTPATDPGTGAAKVKGSFPLGAFGFTTEHKMFLKSTADGKFVFKTFTNEIVVTDSLGAVLHRFTPAVGEVTGIAVDSNNKLYITCTDSVLPNFTRYLKKFELDGTVIGNLVTYGDEDGNPSDADPNDSNTYVVGRPSSPFVTSDGTVYVAIFSEIRKYNAAGVLQDTIGLGHGAADGFIQGNPVYYVESDGAVYVVDDYTTRLQKFDSNGDFVSKITWPKQIDYIDNTSGIPVNIQGIPGSIIRNTDGSFVLTEYMGNEGFVVAFSSAGTFLWAKDGSDRNDADYPVFNGNLMYVSKYNNKYYVGFRDEVAIYNSDGTYAGNHKQRMTGAASVVRLANGTFYVGSGNGIHRYNAKGEWQESFAAGRMIYGLAASDSVLYAVDPTTSGLIYKYSFDGTAQGTITFAGPGAQPMGLSIDKDKTTLYVADGASVYKIPLSTEVAAAFGTGNYDVPAAVSAQKDGTVIVIDIVGGTTTTPKRFNADGTLASTNFDLATSGAIGMSLGVATDSKGRIYVSAALGNKVYVFEANGTFVTTYTSGSLSMPFGMTIDQHDDLFVADSGNSVVKKFSTTDGSIQAE
ncbi:NHL repeat-containing protein [Bdellovibrio reynosensis]|uniref:SMP-30/Gluconolactonase/LRE-like region domain-containing protein n=1 Tax=Bdellovibrio reynosensis TaxID=2835041 RepID=A0ABY4CFC9_9BACT|nr:hypothetical protein [Bdellovibrio reynosensis]UOF02371.1 hypothetical protein MNR06_05330 [Bdellovibrio reynosensis]